MPKYIISELSRYELEAETMEEAQKEFRAYLTDGYPSDNLEYLDGSTTYTEAENV
jgi:hypothetical protein